jgi:hypothetical protein
MERAAPPQAVLAMLSHLGLSFTEPTSKIELPNGLVFTCRPFGLEDDSAALKAAGELFGQADAFRRFCKKRGFAWDIRPIAKIANDPLWVEGLVQYERAVQLALRIVTQVTRGGVTIDPVEDLFSVLMKDQATQNAFLSSAIPPRLIDVAAAARVGRRAKAIWDATLDQGDIDLETQPRTSAEKAALSLLGYAGLWRSGSGGIGLDWAGARALCPAHVVWADMVECLQAIEGAWRAQVAKARPASQNTVQGGVIPKTEDGIDPHAHDAEVYQQPVMGVG